MTYRCRSCLCMPTASVGMMPAENAVKIIYNDEINASDDAQGLIAEKAAAYAALQTSPESAGRQRLCGCDD